MIRYIEAEGWTADDEYVSTSSLPREDETREETLQRIIREAGIVEIGQVSE